MANTVQIILNARDQASKAINSAFGGIQRSASASMAVVARASAAAGAAVLTASGFITKMGVSYNAALEQSEIAWQTLLGTQEKAQDMLKRISDFTKATPFETAYVDQMAKYLHNAGLEGDGLFKELMKIADTASAFSLPQHEAQEMARQMSQVRQAGVAYTEDLNILQDRGIPIYKAIAEQVGINVAEVKKMASEGKLSSEIYLAAFDNIAKGVEGASDAQSKTLVGLWSTLQDNVKIASGLITEELTGRIKGAVETVIPIIENFIAVFEKGGWKGVFDEFLPPGTVSFLTTSFTTIKDVFNQAKDAFVQNKDKIVGVFTSIKDGVMNFINNYKQSVVGLFSGEGNLGESFVRIFNAVKEIALPILQDAISFVKSTLGELTTFWKENGEQIMQAVKNAWSVIASIIEAVAPVILFIVKMLWTNIKGVISGALDVIMGIIKVFAGLFTGDFSKMWEGVKQLFKGAIEFVWNLINLMMIGRILGGIKAFVTNGVSVFSGFWTKTVEIFKNLDTHVWNIISTFVSKIVGKLKGFYDDGARIFDTLRTFGASRMQALKDAVTTTIGNMKTAAVEKVMSMKTSVTDHFSGILNSAKSKFSEIKSAITNPIESAKETIRLAIEKIKGFFTNMKVKIPLPHFSVSTSNTKVAGVNVPVPKLDVDWYDKGGVFYGPQVIGVGEKRPEFVGALDDLRKIVREESSSASVLNITLNYNGSGSKTDAYNMVDILEKELSNRVGMKLRMNGVKG